MKFLNRFTALRPSLYAALGFLIFNATLVLPSFASQSEAVFNTPYLDGVDTIHVAAGYGSFTRQLPLPTDLTRPSVFVRTIQDIFAPRPEVHVISALSPEDDRRSSVLTLFFSISTRTDTVAGKPVDVGALSLQIWRRSPEMSSLLSRPIPVVSYPFIISDDVEEMQKILANAIHRLADHLPGYYACGNQIKSACTTDALKLHYDQGNPDNVQTPALKRTKQ